MKLEKEEYLRRMTIAHHVLDRHTNYTFCTWDGNIYQGEYPVLNMNDLIGHSMIPTDLDNYNIETIMCKPCKLDHWVISELEATFIAERFWERYEGQERN